MSEPEISFETSRFKLSQQGEKSEAPHAYGEDLANWLVLELAKKGVVAEVVGCRESFWILQVALAEGPVRIELCGAVEHDPELEAVKEVLDNTNPWPGQEELDRKVGELLSTQPERFAIPPHLANFGLWQLFIRSDQGSDNMDRNTGDVALVRLLEEILDAEPDFSEVEVWPAE